MLSVMCDALVGHIHALSEEFDSLLTQQTFGGVPVAGGRRAVGIDDPPPRRIISDLTYEASCLAGADVDDVRDVSVRCHGPHRHCPHGLVSVVVDVRLLDARCLSRVAHCPAVSLAP